MQSNPRRIKAYRDSFCLCCGKDLLIIADGSILRRTLRTKFERSLSHNSKRKTLRTHRTGH